MEAKLKRVFKYSDKVYIVDAYFARSLGRQYNKLCKGI